MHKGDVHDPRVAVIEVQVDEVRYWISTENSLTKIVNLSAATLTGRAAAPGELRSLNKEEVRCRLWNCQGGKLMDTYTDCSPSGYSGEALINVHAWRILTFAYGFS